MKRLMSKGKYTLKVVNHPHAKLLGRLKYKSKIICIHNEQLKDTQTIQMYNNLKNSNCEGQRVQMKGFSNVFEIERTAIENNHTHTHSPLYFMVTTNQKIYKRYTKQRKDSKHSTQDSHHSNHKNKRRKEKKSAKTTPKQLTKWK